ncbi:MAG: hypothetical protein HY243_15940 [Proteobacteria bacterium]|nr:hypothetical protein [Pseudomonadota bacterium]
MPSKKDAPDGAQVTPLKDGSANGGTVSVRVLKRGHERISKGGIVPGTFRDEFYRQGDEFEIPHAIASALEERDFVEIKK